MKCVCTSFGLVAVAVGFSFVGACGGSTTDDGSSGTGAAGTISVAGAGGTIVITGAGGSSGTGAGAGGSSTVNIDAACVANVQEGESIPVNLHFLVDHSGSMTCPLGAAGQNCNNQANRMPPDRWSAITDALNAFVAAPASSGIGVGLQFFPSGNNNAECNRATYQIPAVPFALLPGAANGFGIALAQTMPNGDTPTTPALQGAIDFARGQIMANPSRDVAVVLTSDGIPNGCNSTVANAAQAAAAGLAGVAGTPSIKTYVIGVGPQLNNLNMIAAAGGTTQAFLIDTNTTAAGVAAAFTAALGKIAAPITCNYTIPIVPGKPLDLGAVNVQTRVGPTGSAQIVGHVNDGTACGAGGWFYDNNGSPTKITLCPSTCMPLTNTEGSNLQILIGCATQMGRVN